MKFRRILFQGDSITDGARGRNDDLNHILGHGYAYIIASKLGYELAENRPLFLNRGISGNRVSDLYARWNEDTFSLKPDLISILIGVNDAWRIVDGEPEVRPTDSSVLTVFCWRKREKFSRLRAWSYASRSFSRSPPLRQNGKLGRNECLGTRKPSESSLTNLARSSYRYKLCLTMPAREPMRHTGSGMGCTRRRQATN